MAFQNFPGSPSCCIGYNPFVNAFSTPATTAGTLAAATGANIMVGRVVTADGASHTIDTTGSSSLQWATGTVTFASASTTVKIGLAAVDTNNGPPARAVNVSNVITFDVSKSIVGGSGGITATAWQTNTPDTGTKTIANGDLVAFCVQMTARGGSDSVQVLYYSTPSGDPTVTNYNGAGTYATINGPPNAIIVFSDGTLGWFYGSSVFTTFTAQTFQSGSSPNERGQLIQLPFPIRISGCYGQVAAAPAANFQVIIYSDPLGTPVAQLTTSITQKTLSTTAGLRFFEMFTSTYDVPANTPIAVVLKPTTVQLNTAYFLTMDSASFSVTDIWGTSGYGVTRSGGSGAFAQQNSGKDKYLLGLIASAFQQPAAPSLALGF